MNKGLQAVFWTDAASSSSSEESQSVSDNDMIDTLLTDETTEF